MNFRGLGSMLRLFGRGASRLRGLRPSGGNLAKSFVRLPGRRWRPPSHQTIRHGDNVFASLATRAKANAAGVGIPTGKLAKPPASVVKPSPSLAAQERLARLEKARRAAGRHPEAIGHGDPVFNSPSAIANRFAIRAKGKDLLHPPRNLRSWYRDAVGAATGEGTAGATFRHMAGRAPGQRIGIGGTLKALASPRYPGLHAPAGTLASARTLGRSRQALGNALRLGSAAATAGSTAAVAEHLYQGLPRGLAGAALTDSHPGDLAETRYAKQLRGLYPHYLKQLTGISKPKSQYDKTVTDAITRTIVPQARYNMHTARKSHPKAWGALSLIHI